MEKYSKRNDEKRTNRYRERLRERDRERYREREGERERERKSERKGEREYIIQMWPAKTTKSMANQQVKLYKALQITHVTTPHPYDWILWSLTCPLVTDL